MSKTHQDNRTTTYYIIRHAEKETGNDPKLTPRGRERAIFWASYFEKEKLDTVYSTDTTRTLQTASPTADNLGLAIKLYKPDKQSSKFLKKESEGKKVLIVGHTTNIPRLANALMGKKMFGRLSLSQFGQLYIITVLSGNAQGEMKTLNGLEH